MQQEKYVVCSGSQSAIHLSKNLMFHSRSKHIDVRHDWIRDVLESNQLYLEKIHTSENGSDMLTKCLPKEKLEACRQRAGLVEPTDRRKCVIFYSTPVQASARAAPSNIMKVKVSPHGELGYYVPTLI